ncbi:MAG: DUF2059 domain-containing protein [Roseovarius sp.]|uniref:DUF2059 domain-containing protein n=1 Tax=Roseovarius sp. TaxID=1486281 RepID=UPI0032ED6392
MGPIRAAAWALAAAAIWAMPAQSEGRAELDTLLRALRVGDTVEIMREEGLAYADSLAQEMMPDAVPSGWQATVERIYDTGKMRNLVEERMAQGLDGVDLAPLNAFFTSDLGAEVVELELSAREAFLDPEVEEAAQEQYEKLDREGALIVDQIDTLIADSDLIEHNVMGILNSNLMLYRGLADGGAYDLSEEDMLLDVWSQEEGVREDSTAWIGAYLLTAYQPLEDDEVQEYIDLWRSDEGQALNTALFSTFDRMYEELSYLVGQAVAQHLRSQEL